MNKYRIKITKSNGLYGYEITRTIAENTDGLTIDEVVSQLPATYRDKDHAINDALTELKRKQREI